MASTYTTPGVYINEVSTLPASVAQVSTAIPAFVGYTEFALDTNGNSILNVATRITSMVEFEKYFGGSSNPLDNLTDQGLPKIILDQTKSYIVDDIEIVMKYILYQSMNMYFANGGAACYVVSVGDYDYARDETTIRDEIVDGFAIVDLEDEPTLLLAPDAGNLTDPILLGSLHQDMLKQCNKLQDRFCIFDLIEDATSDDLGEGDFRDNIGTQYLKYGAAYGPHLKTTLSYNLTYQDLNIVDLTNTAVLPSIFTSTSAVEYFALQADITAIQAQITADYLDQYDSLPAAADVTTLEARVAIFKDMVTAARGLVDVLTNTDIIAKVATLVVNGSTLATKTKDAFKFAEGFPVADNGPLSSFLATDFDGTDISSLPLGTTVSQFNYALSGSDSSIYTGADEAENAVIGDAQFRELLEESVALFTELMAEAELVLGLVDQAFENSEPIYLGIKNAIEEKGLVVPPSGAVAGAYVATDSNRGVWKAPANVSLNNVVGPTIKVDSTTQEGLNVDATSGKSINVIRSFTGKGILIWGARTLAGNDNEWRYVPVRRLFITIEESIKKATEFVVFESNDRNTWVRTRSMIDNYLTGLWRQGALSGAKPEEAFFVNVGLGTTMTAQDILDGKMIVEIGIAAVRPAEFIILRFSHKLQES